MPSNNLRKVEVLKLLLKIGILSIAGIFTFYLIDFFNPYKNNEAETQYPAAIIDKQKRALSLPSPKIILVGGSNMAFGIDSKMISDSLKMPVVNLAMQYNVGSDFLLKQAKFDAKKGDIIIICFEYIIESEGLKYEKMAIAQYYPEAYNWIDYKYPLEKYIDLVNFKIGDVRRLSDRLLSKKHVEMSINDTEYVFFRKAFNEYGDLLSHFNNPPLKEIPFSLVGESLTLMPVIKDMNSFKTTMDKTNAKVFFSYPPMCQSSFVKNEKSIEKLANELKTNSKVVQINTPKSMAFSDSLFFDMAYHLNVNGRPIRTAKLINDLKLALKKEYK